MAWLILYKWIFVLAVAVYFIFSCFIYCIKLAEIYTVSRTLRVKPGVKISILETMCNYSYKYYFVPLVIVKKK